MKWLYMKNDALDAHSRFPDEDGVQAHWEARGWVVTEEPIEEPFIPRAENVTDEKATFVTMYHPGADATHEFPNNPEAIQGATEAGWTLELPPAGEAPESETTAEKPPARKSRKSKTESEPTGSEHSEEV